MALSGVMNLKKTSRFLSLILRHRPDKIDIELDNAGWIKIDTLLKKIKAFSSNLSITREGLQEVVDTNDKQRFSISDDGKYIRANQGHSVEVSLGYEEQ